MDRQGITPYLCCRGAADAIAFYRRAFGAVELDRMVQPDGRVGHAEIEIEHAVVMLADEFPELEFRSPLALGGSPVLLHLDVADVDRLFDRARSAGARVLQPVEDRSYGERRCKVADPYGHVWILASRLEQTAPPGEAPPEDVARLWDLVDLIMPMAVRVAATLRVADLIAQGHGTLRELALRSGVDPDALGRLLRFLTARGVFKETSPGQFALNGVASTLLDSHASATRQWLDLEGFGGRMDLAFFDLLVAIRSGRPPQPADKAHLPDAIAASYDAVMEAQSRAQTPAIVAGYDWPSRGHVVDLGGGTGTLLSGLLRSYPQMRGTLVELPETAQRARRVIAQEGLDQRCAVIGGDLFEVTPPGGDIYILKFVLHSLEDDAARRALRRCRDAGGPDSRVLVIEHTVAPGDDRSAFTAMDLRMLILGHGRERTLEEYSALAERAGLRLSAATASSTGLHLIELRRGALKESNIGS